MVITRYILIIPLYFALLLPISARAASLDIAIFKKNIQILKISDGEDGSALSNITMLHKFTNLYTHDHKVADIDSAQGVEWIRDVGNGIVKINEQDGEFITEFTALSTSGKLALAVGNVSDNSAGKEIAVCHKIADVPLLKVFSYSEISGASELLSFKPYGNRASKQRGCNAIGIGDTDGDGENEIVTFKTYSSSARDKEVRVQIFDSTGEVEEAWDLPINAYPDYQGSYDREIYIQDIDGDGADEIIFMNTDDAVFIYDEKGNELYSFDAIAYNGKAIKKIEASDVDGDGKAEVIIEQAGIKIPVLILGENLEVENSFNLFPNATVKGKRHLFLGNFDY